MNPPGFLSRASFLVLVTGPACEERNAAPPAYPEPDTASELRMGVLEGSDGPQITLPDTVVAGEPFQIVLETFGSGCLAEAYRLEIVPGQRGITITPFDRWRAAFWIRDTGEGGCTDIEKRVQHRETYVFESPGQHQVRIRGLGRRIAGPGAARHDTTAIEKVITVVEPR